jgi:hypothetical protein
MKAFIPYYGYIITVLVDGLIPSETPVVNPDFALYKLSYPIKVKVTKIYHIETKQYVKKVYRYDIIRKVFIYEDDINIEKTFQLSIGPVVKAYKTKKAAISFASKSGWCTRYNSNGSFKEKLYFNPNNITNLNNTINLNNTDNNTVLTMNGLSGYTKKIFPLGYNNLLVKHDYVRNLTTIKTSSNKVVKKYKGIVKEFHHQSINIKMVDNYRNLRLNGARRWLEEDGSMYELTYFKNDKIHGKSVDEIFDEDEDDQFSLYDRGEVISTQIISIIKQISCILFKKTRFVIK